MSTEKQLEALSKGHQKGTKKVRIGALTSARLIQLLDQGTFSPMQLAEESGMCRSTVSSYLRALGRVGMVHVVEWEQDSHGRFQHPIMKLGPGASVKKPKPLSNTERWRRDSRQRKKAKDAQIVMQNALAGVANAE